MKIEAIGYVKKDNQGMYIELKKEYVSALTAIEGFSYLTLVWWAHLYATDDARKLRVLDKPYKKGPDKIGIFATRSPVRPNPICISPMPVQSIDMENGIIRTWWIDCEDNTPILDIKPYHPCSDTVKNAEVPEWCSHWPQSYEDSAEFAWDEEFNF